MKFDFKKKSRDIIAFICACGFVIAGLRLLHPPEEIHLSLPQQRNYISLSTSAYFDNDDTSISFFIPTTKNFNYQESIPSLKYEIGISEIKEVGVFSTIERSNVISYLDLLVNVNCSNILETISLRSSKNFMNSDTITKPIGKPPIIFKNILTGKNFESSIFSSQSDEVLNHIPLTIVVRNFQNRTISSPISAMHMLREVDSDFFPSNDISILETTSNDNEFNRINEISNFNGNDN